MKRILQIFLIIVILVIAAIYIGIGYAEENILPYSILKPQRITSKQSAEMYGMKSDPAEYNLRYDDLNIAVADSVNLKGWFIYACTPKPIGTVLLLHGVASCRASQLQFAAILASKGMNCVLYDSRANGESGGEYCTYGYYEKKDVSKIIDYVSANYPASGPYGIVGHSMGAATALQAMEIDKRLVCGIVMSPFGDFRKTIRDYIMHKVHLRLNKIADASIAKSEIIANYKADSIKPAISAKHIEQPVMVIHGLEDKNVSALYGREVYENLLSPDKIWFPIYKGGHNNLFSERNKMMLDYAIAFLKKYISEAGSKHL